MNFVIFLGFLIKKLFDYELSATLDRKAHGFIHVYGKIQGEYIAK